MKLQKLPVSQTSLLTPSIDEHLRTREVKAAFKSGQRRIHPSGLADCARSIVFNILGKPSVDFTSPKMKRVYDNGNDMHDRYSNYIHSTGKFKVIDGKEAVKYPVVDKDLWIDGEADGIVVLDALDYVLELKSMRAESFVRLARFGNISERYIIQAATYMGVLGIPRTLFLFENKNNQEPLEIVIKFDENLWTSLVRKIQFIQECVEKAVYPTRQCLSQGSPLRCPYQNYCFSKETGD